MAEGWQNGTVEEHRVRLPGTTHTNGIGPKYEKKLISNLTPVTNHVGPAWYWRDIELSESDCARFIELSLERCCWESFVWLNGKAPGTRDSLVAPHVYDLSPAVKPGTNRLTVMITALRESKGIVTPARFRQFCGETVPLARLGKRTFTTDETFEADVDLAHYGPSDLLDSRFAWRLLSDDGDVRAKGKFAGKRLPTGALTRLGSISVALSRFRAPEKFCLEVSQQDGGAINSWDCWVYPPPAISKPKDVLWAKSWSAELAARVAAGQTAILELGPEQISHARRGCFTSLLWNPIMKRKHRSQTMGILCDPAHPALSGFPTEAHSNWQWWDVIHPSLVLDLDGMSPRPEPIVRMIDSFIGNHCLCLIFEVKMGKGRLLVTSLDLSNDLASRPAARQLRQSLLDYVASDAFRPSVAIVPGDIEKLIEAHRQEPVVPTRAEVIAQFDQAVVRESPKRQQEKQTK